MLPLIHHIVESTHNSDGDQEDFRAPPADKIRRNALSAETETLLRVGQQKVMVVQEYIREFGRPEYGDVVADALNAKYIALREQRLAPDDIFGELLPVIGGFGPNPKTSVAVLAIAAYFFQTCDIFERGD